MTETELVFTEILNCNRLSLYLNRDRTLGKRESALLSSVLRRRIRGEPIQYILGKTEFMGLEFKLRPGVFIPRPETEIIVQAVINSVKLLCPVRNNISCAVKDDIVKLLDIGTGSGNIAISLARLLPFVRITATDISPEALKIARENALLNNVEINFLQSNLFSNYELPISNYELIVSNPPYIPTAEIENLESELNYEPHIALDGGRDSLDFYRRIIQAAPAYLKKGGFLILEMGFDQCARIKKLFKFIGEFEIIKVIKDYNNIDRVIVAQYQSK